MSPANQAGLPKKQGTPTATSPAAAPVLRFKGNGFASFDMQSIVNEQLFDRLDLAERVNEAAASPLLSLAIGSQL